VPRDRNGEFEPQLVKKHQRRFEGFDEQVIGLYARGLSTPDIQSQLEELYGIEVSPTLISNVTSAVLEDVRSWQGRSLEALYPIVYFDALFVKSRQDGPLKNKAVYLALRRIARKWTMPIANWKAALNQFVFMFDDRVIL
jgi:putative transposase